MSEPWVHAVREALKRGMDEKKIDALLRPLAHAFPEIAEAWEDPKQGWVYVVRPSCSPDWYKIGVSRSVNLAVRFGDLLIALPCKLEVIWCDWVSDPLEKEKELHRFFEEYRGQGEWFALGQMVKEYLLMTFDKAVVALLDHVTSHWRGEPQGEEAEVGARVGDDGRHVAAEEPNAGTETTGGD